MAKIIDRIMTWASNLKYWEQEALALIPNGADITDLLTEIQAYDALKAKHKQLKKVA
jgi:hypothetical protein